MKRILFINSVYGFGSTGRIVASLNEIDEFESYACFGRKENLTVDTNVEKVTKFVENAIFATKTILFNESLNGCNIGTDKLFDIIDNFRPDLIHLHNLHGYYINIERLLVKLKEYDKPIVWTLHDCWPLTGYCCHFDYAKCNSYMNCCTKCEHRFSYPFSIFKQNTKEIHDKKTSLILGLKEKLVFVTPSEWLKRKVEESRLKEINTIVINNGIDLPKVTCIEKNKEFSIIAVANYWTLEKGLEELRKIIALLDKDIKITIVGEIKNKKGFEKCNLIERTDNFEELLNLYSSHHLFINPTLEDNFPTVNIESLACGTPVISYETGGSPEIFDEKCGIAIKKYDYECFAKTINAIKNNYSFKNDNALQRSKKYSKNVMIRNYVELYNKLLEDLQ